MLDQTTTKGTGADGTCAKGARIKVIGVGGAGGNALNTMLEGWSGNTSGVDFIAANTDLQALKGNRALIKLQLGNELTRGLGAGADPEVGRKAAIESEAEITKLLEGADMVFITAGMGGGTGTGAAPVIARIARDLGALSVGIVSRPFNFEGKRRSRVAEQGIEQIRDSVDSLITIPNERLLLVAGKDMAMVSAFKMADEVLLHAVRGISDLILVEGLINLDFADIRTVMSATGMTLMGSGVAEGEHRSIEAATRAISSPLLENISIRGATGILLNVTGGSGLTLFEVNEAAKIVQEEAHEEATIIFGAVIDGKLDPKQVRVTVIATGFEAAAKRPLQFNAYQKPTPPVPREQPAAPAITPPMPSQTYPLTIISSSQATGNRFNQHRRCVEGEAPTALPVEGATRAPISTTLRRIIGEIKSDSFASPDPDTDEYDIPTFLRKHAD